MPRENKTQYALLGYLHYMPMSGYDLKKSIDSSIRFFWQENYGHIYPVLKRLEKDGYVTMTVEENPGKPSKKVYAITEKGKDYFREWMDRPPEPENIRKEILLKIFFSGFYDDSAIETYIENEKKQQHELIETYESIRAHINSSHQSDEYHKKRWIITIESGIEMAQSQIRWAETALDMLRA